VALAAPKNSAALRYSTATHSPRCMRNDYQKYEIWNSLCASMVLSASAFSAGLKVVL
jgi:hypothetical protein